jgi:hypothetical protein
VALDELRGFVLQPSTAARPFRPGSRPSAGAAVMGVFSEVTSHLCTLRLASYCQVIPKLAYLGDALPYLTAVSCIRSMRRWLTRRSRCTPREKAW